MLFKNSYKMSYTLYLIDHESNSKSILATGWQVSTIDFWKDPVELAKEYRQSILNAHRQDNEDLYFELNEMVRV